MKLTYFVPTTEQNQEMVCAQVRRLFQVEPSFAPRAGELQVDLAALTNGEVPPLVGQMLFAIFGVCGAMEQKSGLGESGKKGRRYIFSFTFSSSMQGKILYHSSSGRSGVRNGRC